MSGVLNLLLAGAASAIKDAYYNLTTLLLNTSSTNGAQNNTFLDSSTNNFTITRNGNTTQGTFTPFSQTGWSNYFNGSSTISFGTSSATNILAYDTFECWVNMPVIGTNDLIAGRDGNFWMGYNFTGIGGTANKFVFSIWTGSSWQAVSSTTTPVVGVWYHLLGVKDNTTMRFYVNGVQENTSTFSGTPVTTGTFYVASNNNIENFEGYISNLRLITGATNAVFPYAGLTTGASFTPPTSALTAVTGTALLTCQSNRFVDNSSNNLSATITSIPSVQAFSPFAPTAAYDAAVVGGSGYFDGTSDYLSLSSTSLNLGANDFTIETWVYATTTARDFVIGSLRNADGAGSWVIMFNDSQPIRFFCRYNGGTVLDYQVGSGTFPINTWTHLAITRSGANLRVFQNGTQVGTTNTTLSTFSIDNASTNYYVASSTDPGEFYTGYLSGTRLLVGTALYTTTFTPPTAPPTAITNTTLLLNYTNSGIFDSAAKNVLETVGNAQVSTTQAKWGTTSMYFDGSGDWLVTPNGRNYINGTEPFTIECWVYVTGTPSFWSICGAASGTLVLTIQNLTTININPYGSGNTISVTTSLSTNTWTHIAATRDSSNRFDIWVNGVSAGNATSSQSFGSPTNYVIGAADSGGTQSFNGYIDDLRISKFCRYTTTFTPPTAAFPVQ